jgi:hypothetical protein
MDNPNAFAHTIVLTDIAGEHFWTDTEMFCPMDDLQPLPKGVRCFASNDDADREIALQAARGIHLKRQHIGLSSRRPQR